MSLASRDTVRDKYNILNQLDQEIMQANGGFRQRMIPFCYGDILGYLQISCGCQDKATNEPQIIRIITIKC